MKDLPNQLTIHLQTAGRVSALLQRRLQRAAERSSQRLEGLAQELLAATLAAAGPLSDARPLGARYAIDSLQRALLVADVLRDRGNNFVAHARAGSPPLLHFDYEMVLDARGFARPVNYALVRIVPPAGVQVDAARRPYIIIDPRAGHGPGIGGFKDDSQVGVALAAGHPVYFVIFFPEPMPGQTLLDVTEVQRTFVARVRELHPQSAKPAIVGNCQGGWAAMMLAAAEPGQTGPLVINGAPMSYWGGAWSDGPGDNPMRYSGGLLGGTWLASLMADLGNGVFDGAWLVQNFENLNPANTYWAKYYNLYANVDTEAPRFLEFERWWGGFYLMNREEIEWITQNLFVSNKLWREGIRSRSGRLLDLREIRAPVVLFASMGDNITPPQQAFNWVADVYSSTEEIKARGQVIVGLLHEDIGHLGIFVSGKVAQKEYRQIVSVLKSIESLSPGLWAMQILDRQDANGVIEHEVQFVEKRLEDVVARLNRQQREDEKPFEAVAAISEFNQRAYELFARPLMQALGNESIARTGREYHPMRFQRWAWSDLNPALWWVGPTAQWARSQRQPLPDGDPLRRAEAACAALITTALDYWRDVRDALSEAVFFQMYGPLFGALLVDRPPGDASAGIDPRQQPEVQSALAAIQQGGLAAALARMAVLLARNDEPLPLDRLQRNWEIGQDFSSLMPALPPDEWRRLRGTQELIVRFEPEAALVTLPLLLTEGDDRVRFTDLFERLMSDRRVTLSDTTAEQRKMIARIRALLQSPATSINPRPQAAHGLQAVPTENE